MSSRRWVSRVDGLLRSRPAVPETTEVEAEREYASRVVELAARVGQIAIGAGMSAADTRTTVWRVAGTYGVRVHVDVTYMSVLVSCSVKNGTQVTRLRSASVVYWDFSQLARVEAFVHRVARGDMDIESALVRVRALEFERMLYRPWVQTVAATLLGVSMGFFLGATWLEAAFAGLATTLVWLLLDVLGRRQVPYFFVHMASAAVPTVLALLLMTLRQHGVPVLWGVRPSIVVASGVVWLLAGLSVVNAAQDALDGYFVTANARILDLLMRTGGLIAGVMVTLWAGLKVGVPASITPAVAESPPLLQLLVCSFSFSVLFAVAFSVGPRAAVLCGGLGALAWASYALAMPVTRDHVASVAFAAVVVGFVAQFGSRPWKVPAIALLTCAIAPLMPGLLLYRGLYGLIMPMPLTSGDQPLDLIQRAAMSGIALAVGGSAGSSLARALRAPTAVVIRHVPHFGPRREPREASGGADARRLASGNLQRRRSRGATRLGRR